MSIIDHRYEAELAASAGKYDIAQYEATMYAAEQQRIANLIAYMAMPEEAGERESDAWPLITKGLGL